MKTDQPQRPPTARIFCAACALNRGQVINAVLKEVAELPDRTRPLDALHMMLVSEYELRLILEDLLP